MDLGIGKQGISEQIAKRVTARVVGNIGNVGLLEELIQEADMDHRDKDVRKSFEQLHPHYGDLEAAYTQRAKDLAIVANVTPQGARGALSEINIYHGEPDPYVDWLRQHSLL